MSTGRDLGRSSLNDPQTPWQPDTQTTQVSEIRQHNEGGGGGLHNDNKGGRRSETPTITYHAHEMTDLSEDAGRNGSAKDNATSDVSDNDKTRGLSEDELREADEDKEVKGPCQGCYTRYSRVVAVLVRLLLLVHSWLAVWLVVSLLGNLWLCWLLGLGLFLLVEMAFTLVKRGGRESKWVCWCFLAYLAAVLPPIWLVELDRLARFNQLESSANLTSLTEVNGLTVPLRLEPQVWVSLVEQTLLFLLVLCRWLLPRGDISRHELSQLLFVFMGIASDNMELFELFDESEVRGDRTLTYVVLGVWSLSLLQFVFVLTATKNSLKISRVAPVRLGGERRREGAVEERGGREKTEMRLADEEGLAQGRDKKGGRREAGLDEEGGGLGRRRVRNGRREAGLDDEVGGRGETRRDTGKRRRKKSKGCCEVVFSTEVWSLAFSVMVQDGPYAAVRIYTLVTHDIQTYSIYFFILKNLLVVVLVLYRLVVICIGKFTDYEYHDDEDDDYDTESEEGGGTRGRGRRTLLTSSHA